jgi:hypothetical protein
VIESVGIAGSEVKGDVGAVSPVELGVLEPDGMTAADEGIERARSACAPAVCADEPWPGVWVGDVSVEITRVTGLAAWPKAFVTEISLWPTAVVTGASVWLMVRVAGATAAAADATLALAIAGTTAAPRSPAGETGALARPLRTAAAAGAVGVSASVWAAAAVAGATVATALVTAGASTVPASGTVIVARATPTTLLHTRALANSAQTSPVRTRLKDPRSLKRWQPSQNYQKLVKPTSSNYQKNVDGSWL